VYLPSVVGVPFSGRLCTSRGESPTGYVTRTELLQYVGILCVIAAIVGGGVNLAGYSFGALNSLRRQGLLALFGVILVAWGPASSMVSEPRRVARSLSNDIETEAAEFNEYINRGERVPQSEMDGLTRVYLRLRDERATLGETFYRLLKTKADLAMKRANGADVDSEWNSVNDEISSELDWP
jgi:hypothetical protein